MASIADLPNENADIRKDVGVEGASECESLGVTIYFVPPAGLTEVALRYGR